MKTFFQVLTEAVDDMVEYGFDSQKRIEEWVRKIKAAAIASLVPDYKVNLEMEKALVAAYHRSVTKGGLISKNVSRYDLEKIKPSLRAELDRRIMVSANLIKYNREESISNTLRKFEGWATSIPKGGSDYTKKVEEKAKIRKDLNKLSFMQRRVVIDQTHKLVANINNIVAVDNGAIAAQWHSIHTPGYDYRKDHRERDDNIYLIKDSWAKLDGLIKPVNGYTDDITSPGEEVYCRCSYVYLYNLRQLPEKFLTVKGKKAMVSINNK
jgi:hypothetical protein